MPLTVLCGVGGTADAGVGRATVMVAAVLSEQSLFMSPACWFLIGDTFIRQRVSTMADTESFAVVAAVTVLCSTPLARVETTKSSLVVYFMTTFFGMTVRSQYHRWP